jgi:methylated-DNA-[protein]-cysteine S-methyltransferase
MHWLLRRHYGSYTLEEGAAPLSLTQALDAYFAGCIDVLAAVEIATGGTPFQRRVWRALGAIPAGTTVSYGHLAGHLGENRASRAVGAANGANPIAIVVPCHRVIGANGGLTGYAGGLLRKQWLLEHEASFFTLTASEKAVSKTADRSECPAYSPARSRTDFLREFRNVGSSRVKDDQQSTDS